MKCPHCGLRRTGVIDTRYTATGIRRRRACKNCGTKFSTFETLSRFQESEDPKSPAERLQEARRLINNIIADLKFAEMQAKAQ